MIIRNAELKDSFSISKICKNDLGYECTSEIISYRLNNLDKNREVVFVAEIDKTVIGFIHAEIYKVLYCESMINILGLAVSSNYRKQGAGKLLLTAIEEWAKSLDIKIIRLNSGSSRTDAHSFYTSNGYTNKKEQIRFIKNLQQHKSNSIQM